MRQAKPAPPKLELSTTSVLCENAAPHRAATERAKLWDRGRDCAEGCAGAEEALATFVVVCGEAHRAMDVEAVVLRREARLLAVQVLAGAYSFDELSDGERALVARYVVLHAVAGPGKVLLLDEPDNYLGLREIQPWLAEFTDRALRSVGPQVILLSHHPEALNFLAPERGFRLFRDDNGPTRIEKFERAR